jgi:hypothetical protein
MGRINLTTALLMMMAALSAACGSTEDEQDAAEADAGTVGFGGSPIAAFDAGAAGAAAALPRCDDIEGLDPSCAIQVVLPTPGAAGAAGAGGAPGAAGAAGAAWAALCTIPLEFEDFNPNEVNLAVDCEVIPYCNPDDDATVECWQYVDVASPTAIVLSKPLCARITEEGFARIDIVLGCGGPIID